MRKGNVFTSLCQEFCPQVATHGKGVGMHGKGGVRGKVGMHGKGDGVCVAKGACIVKEGHAW